MADNTPAAHLCTFCKQPTPGAMQHDEPVLALAAEREALRAELAASQARVAELKGALHPFADGVMSAENRARARAALTTKDANNG